MGGGGGGGGGVFSLSVWVKWSCWFCFVFVFVSVLFCFIFVSVRLFCFVLFCFPKCRNIHRIKTAATCVGHVGNCAPLTTPIQKTHASNHACTNLHTLICSHKTKTTRQLAPPIQAYTLISVRSFDQKCLFSVLKHYIFCMTTKLHNLWRESIRTV